MILDLVVDIGKDTYSYSEEFCAVPLKGDSIQLEDKDNDVELCLEVNDNAIWHEVDGTFKPIIVCEIINITGNGAEKLNNKIEEYNEQEKIKFKNIFDIKMKNIWMR